MDLESATHALVEADPRFRRAGWNALVDGFDLLPHRLKPLHTLSTGSRRKVGLAAALACGRPLILLDEPGAALDSSSARHLWRALEALARRGDQLVVVASADRSLPLDWTNVIELPRR
jgi:ABC-type multidrug transport system ATPase subunit